MTNPCYSLFSNSKSGEKQDRADNADRLYLYAIDIKECIAEQQWEEEEHEYGAGIHGKPMNLTPDHAHTSHHI